MTEPLPKNVRQAGYNALEELSNRMLRGATSLLKHAARLRTEDAACHREAIAQLRRYRGFKMPCSEEVLAIEAAILGLTEADSRALEERRRIQKMHKDAADRELVREWEEERQHQRVPWHAPAPELQEKIQAGLQAIEADLGLISDRVGECEAKRAARASKPRRKPHQGGNVVAGPWDGGGEARP